MTKYFLFNFITELSPIAFYASQKKKVACEFLDNVKVILHQHNSVFVIMLNHLRGVH